MAIENNSASVKGKKGFQPGKSGNPGGRPRNNPELKEAFRQYTIEARNTLIEVMQNGEKDSDRVRAAEVVLNRAWGTPEQAIAVSGSVASVEVDTSKLDKKDQDALLTALVGIYSGNQTVENEVETSD